jgi:hypothetical protein
VLLKFNYYVFVKESFEKDIDHVSITVLHLLLTYEVAKLTGK